MNYELTVKRNGEETTFDLIIIEGETQEKVTKASTIAHVLKDAQMAFQILRTGGK